MAHCEMIVDLLGLVVRTCQIQGIVMVGRIHDADRFREEIPNGRPIVAAIR
jgi:hypothetical protein